MSKHNLNTFASTDTEWALWAQQVQAERLAKQTGREAGYTLTPQGVKNLNPGPVTRLFERSLQEQAQALDEAEGLLVRPGTVVKLRSDEDHSAVSALVAKRYSHLGVKKAPVVVKKTTQKAVTSLADKLRKAGVVR